MNTQTKSIMIAVVVALVLAVAAFIYFTPPAAAPGSGNEIGGNPAPAATGTQAAPAATPTSTPSATVTPTSGSPGSAPAPAAGGITKAQVATHATASSCWTIIRDSVYDLTGWISKHPGGRQAILQLCGKDGTAAFTGQHGGQSQQENALASFKIGALAQ